jgi:hypothetical protein
VGKPHVFVSYSHRDERILRSLLPYLELLRREGVADIWVDTELKGGARWRNEIDEALDAASIAVLMISQSFLVSRFIYEEELPRIFRRQQNGKLTVLPVFLSPSTVTSASIPFVDVDGMERRVILSDFQGFGTPEKTIRELAAVERDRRFVNLHDRIRELATATHILPGTQVVSAKEILENGYNEQSGRDTAKSGHTQLPAPNVGSMEVSSDRAITVPRAVILDRHYAYGLTSYSNDAMQQHSAQLLQKYHELFDVLTCCILIFDEIYLEQHHVSSIDSLLNERETSAFFDLFTPFSLAETVGSLSENAVVEDMIKNDLEDSSLRLLIASYYGRRPVRPENNKELVIYLNTVLQHAQALNAAIFSRPNRMPLFRHKFRSNHGTVGNDDAGTSYLTSVSVQIPTGRSRSLDELAALRSEPTRNAVRAWIWEQAHERVLQQLADPPRHAEDIDARNLVASGSEFSRKVELSIAHSSLPIGSRYWHFLVIDS